MGNTTLVNQHFPKRQGNTKKYKVDGALRVPLATAKRTPRLTQLFTWKA